MATGVGVRNRVGMHVVILAAWGVYAVDHTAPSDLNLNRGSRLQRAM